MIEFFSLALGLLVTILIEFVLVLILLKENKIKIFFYVLLINLFTWPLANLAYGLFGLFWVIEGFVVLIEFLLIMILFKIRWLKALIISLIANLVTSFFSLVFLRL